MTKPHIRLTNGRWESYGCWGTDEKRKAIWYCIARNKKENR